MKLINFKILIFSILLISSFAGCFSSSNVIYEDKKRAIIAKELSIFKKHGYTKAQAMPWVERGVSYDAIKHWLNEGVISSSIVWKWHQAGFDTYRRGNSKYPNQSKYGYAIDWYIAGVKNPQDAIYFEENGISHKDIQKWKELGISNFSMIKGIKYAELIAEIKRQQLSLGEYKVWLGFGLLQPDDIAYFKTKGYNLNNINGQNGQAILNKMGQEEFFEFVNITSVRLQNKYLDHWKYDTNFKRFRNIVHKYYYIK